MAMDPDVREELMENTSTFPPVLSIDLPPLTDIGEFSLSATLADHAPTVKSMLPLRPSLAWPVETFKLPVSAASERPVLTSKKPLDPESPALYVRKINEPLVVASPTPVDRDIAPPLARKFPPGISPEFLPTLNIISPDLPLLESPVEADLYPLVPLLAVPELK